MIDGPDRCIWRREFTFPWHDGWWHQCYYLVRAEESELTGGEDTHAAKWWSADEIAASNELFAPARLAELLADLLRERVPAEPIDVGV